MTQVPRYAAYGSNLHPRRLRERCASAELLGVHALPGYTLSFNKRSNLDGSAKCSLSAGRGHAWLAIYSLSAGDRRVLDDIEGLGKGYEVLDLTLPAFASCFTYIAAPTHIDDRLSPLEWYRDLVVAGCAYHGFARDYVERIRSTPALVDVDERRARHHRALVARLEQ